MAKIIEVERKRILNLKTFLVFLAVVVLFSVYSSYSTLGRYNIPDQTGIAIKWHLNLTHAKENTQGKYIDREYLSFMREYEKDFYYIDEKNFEELIFLNYEGKSVWDLSDADIDDFYLKRLSNIRAMLEENPRITYTQEEIERFMQSAGQISKLEFGYAEGWKVLNGDMGKFIPILLLLIAIIMLPLFGVEPKTKMRELYRSTKYGKAHLDRARFITAFMVGSLLYLSGIILYFVIKIIPFGLEGWNQCIQSNTNTFFSLYNITNLQQFLINTMIGYVVLLFIISFTLLITILIEGIMAGAAVLVFFLMLLLLFEQMSLYPVNHFFANFMPLRMTSFLHYYIDNEIYRVFGYSLTCMNWSILLSGLIAGILLLLAIGCEKIKRKRGLC